MMVSAWLFLPKAHHMSSAPTCKLYYRTIEYRESLNPTRPISTNWAPYDERMNIKNVFAEHDYMHVLFYWKQIQDFTIVNIYQFRYIVLYVYVCMSLLF